MQQEPCTNSPYILDLPLLLSLHLLGFKWKGRQEHFLGFKWKKKKQNGTSSRQKRKENSGRENEMASPSCCLSCRGKKGEKEMKNERKKMCGLCKMNVPATNPKNGVFIPNFCGCHMSKYYRLALRYFCKISS